MKKMLMALSFLLTLLLSACTTSSFSKDIPLDPLIFNPSEINAIIHRTVNRGHFNHSLNNRQINVIFPMLDIVDRKGDYFRFYYDVHGRREEVNVWIDEARVGVYVINRLEIGIGFGREFTSSGGYGFSDDGTFEDSDVHGVAVTVLMVGREGTDQFIFDASFVIDDIYYHVSFEAYEESGQAAMTEIVNGLILNGTDVFAILVSPVVGIIRFVLIIVVCIVIRFYQNRFRKYWRIRWNKIRKIKPKN